MTVGSGSLEHRRGDRPYWQDHGQDSQEPHSKVVVVVIVFLGPRGPLVEPSNFPPVPSATIFPEFIYTGIHAL